MKRDEVRQVDKVAIERFGMSGLVLMENAGRNAAEQILQRCPEVGEVLLICGAGNNGGDGYVIARHLQLRGRDVRVISLVDIDHLKGDAAANAGIAAKAGIRVDVAKSSSQIGEWISGDASPRRIVIDCMLGTGASGEPRGLYADAIIAVDGAAGFKVAIDIPTGLDCDTGRPSQNTFRADLTITFVAMKDGFHAEPASAYTGEVVVVGIGVPKMLLEQFGVF